MQLISIHELLRHVPSHFISRLVNKNSKCTVAQSHWFPAPESFRIILGSYFYLVDGAAIVSFIGTTSADDDDVKT